LVGARSPGDQWLPEPRPPILVLEINRSTAPRRFAMMHRFFGATGRFAVRFRLAIVAAWVVATVLAIAFLPSLASVLKESNTDQLPAGSPSLAAARLAAPLQDPNQTSVLVVVARGSGTVTAADAAAIGRLTARLATVADVQQVKDLGESADRQAVQLEVLAGLNLADTKAPQHMVTGLRDAITASALPSDLQAHLAGPVPAQADASQAGQKALALGLGLSIVFIVALLLLVFRALLAPLLTLAPAVLVTQLAGPVIGVAGKAGLAVSPLSQDLMLILTIGVGTDYGLFLVFRVREELRAGRAPHEAVTHALARVGESITFSAATIIAALLTMLLATYELYSGIGAPLAIALALMLAADLTLLPALLAIAGRAAFWPSRTDRGTGQPGWWGRAVGRAVAHPAATLAFGLLAFGALAIAVLGYRPADLSTPGAPGGSDSAAGNALLAAHFPTATSDPTMVVLRFDQPAWDDPAPVAAAQRRLAALPQFASLAGPFDALTPGQLTTLHSTLGGPAAMPAVPSPGSRIPPATWAAYGAETQFISADGRTVAFDARLVNDDPGSNAALRQVPAIRAAVAAVARAVGASDYGVAGAVPAGYDLSQVSDADLLRVLPVAIIAIALLLALVLRSLIAPLYLIASVVLSYLAAWGVSVLLFQDAAGAGGLYHAIPFLMFIFLLALGEDYNILVMTRIREEAGRIPLRQAVTAALQRTGPTVSSAGLILAGTFAVFALAVRSQPGGGLFVFSSIAIGVLMDAFLVRTLLVPATVALLGRWNWWPSSHGTPGQTGPEEAERQNSANRQA
jgi:RND superfamily putative drug exporter